MTTTGPDDTRTGRALIVGVDRPGAAQVFGGALERVVVTTYDDMAADLATELATDLAAEHDPTVAAPTTDPLVFVGVAAGPGMQQAVDAALALVRQPGGTGQEPPVLAVEIPWDLDALDHLRARLTDPAAPALTGVRRFRDRPCVVLGGPSAPVADPAWVLDAVLTAGTTAPDARTSHQEQVAAEWERAAAAAQLQRKEEQLRRVRTELAEARQQLGDRRDGPRTRPAGGRGPGQKGRPAPQGQAQARPAGPAASARSLFAVVGRRVGRGPRAGLLVTAVLALLALVLPAVVFGLVAGAEGVVVGLALGVLLLGLAALAAVVALAQRSTTARLAHLERVVARQGRDARGRSRRQLAVVEETRDRARRQGRRLRKVQRAVDAVPAHLTRTVQNDGLTVRRQVQALVNLSQMAPMRAGVPALGGWAASPDFAVEVVDRLLEQRPRLVVEAGSGVSTLLLALAAREHGLDTRIVSLDHDAHYAAQTRELLERHGVADRAEVRWAPLARTHVPGHLTPWYDEAAIADLHDVGMLVVDGPPTATGPAARYPAVPLLRDRLAARCTIVVDDTTRASDLEVTERWALLLPDFEVRSLPLEKGAVVMRRG